MKKWQPLKKGDIVDIVAPAYGVKERVERSINYIKSIGLIPRVPEDFHGEDLFCSNNPKARFTHLKNSLHAEDSKAVWCIQGGYGTAHLIPELENISPPNNAKLVIGFSDITALHIFLNQKWKWCTVHGPVLWQMADKKITRESEEHLIEIIFGKKKEEKFSLIRINNIGSGEIKSTLTGGNATIIQNSIGTIWQLDSKDKIVLLEEIDEEPYRIDRMLTHITQSGIINKASAIIFGDFNSNKIEIDDKKVDSLLRNFSEKLQIPVLRIPGVGHTDTNYPVPMGTKTTISLAKEPFLVSQSGVKSD